MAEKVQINGDAMAAGGDLDLVAFSKALGTSVDPKDHEEGGDSLGKESSEETSEEGEGQEVLEDPRLKADSEEKSEESESDAEEEEAEEDADDKPKKEAAKKPKHVETPDGLKFERKELSVKTADGDSVKIPNDAKIKVTVNGKEKEMFLQDVINKASGVERISEENNKFAKFKQEEMAALSKERMELDQQAMLVEDSANKIKHINKLANEGKPIDTIVYLARLAGQNPIEAVKKFMDSTSKWNQYLQSQNAEGLAAFYDRLQVGIDKVELEEERQKIAAERKRGELQKTASSIGQYATAEIARFGVTDKDFAEKANELAKSKKFSSEDPKQRVDQVFDALHEDRIVKFVKEISPESLKDDALIDMIFDVTFRKGLLRPDQVREVVAGVLGKEAAEEKRRITENLNRKAQKGRTSKAGSGIRQVPKGTPVTEREWEDLMDLEN